MAIQFQRLATPGEGVSTLLDFAPLAGAVNDGITGYYDNKRRTAIGAAAQQGNAAAAQEAMKQGELDTGLQYQRLASQDKQTAQADKDRQIKILGSGAQAALYEKDPQRAQAIWNRVIQAAGVNPADMDPDELDYRTGPKAFMAMAGMAQDPLDVKLKEAQINKYNADARDQGSDFGKTGTTVQGPDGNYYTVRYKSDGTEVINRLQIGGQTVVPDRGVDIVGDTAINKTTGNEVRNVGDAIRGGEAAKVEGKGGAERKMELPKARASLRALETQHRNVKSTIERAMPKINAWTAGLAGQTLGALGSTDANDLRTLLNTVKANLGFDKLQDMRDNSPTGGALGQVAVAELEMLQSAFASVEQSQTPEQLRENMTYLDTLITEMQDNRRMAFDDTYGGQNRPQASPSRAVPPQAVDVLRRDPSPDAVREFNEVFGPGAAERVLNGR